MHRGSLDERIDHFMRLRGVKIPRERVRERFLRDEALEDAARILDRRGVDAEYWHSGGGIMAIRIEDEPRNVVWIWGWDGVLGFGLDVLEPWESTSFGESFEDIQVGATGEQIANKIQERMAGEIPPAGELE